MLSNLLSIDLQLNRGQDHENSEPGLEPVVGGRLQGASLTKLLEADIIDESGENSERLRLCAGLASVTRFIGYAIDEAEEPRVTMQPYVRRSNNRIMSLKHCQSFLKRYHFPLPT